MKRSKRSAILATVAATAATAIAGCGTSHTTGTTAPPQPNQPKTSAAQGGAGTDPSYRGPLTLHRGPVQTDPKLVFLYWGPYWDGKGYPADVRAAEQSMAAKLPNSSWGRVLGQYGVHNDIHLIKAWVDPQPPGQQAVTY